MRQRPILFSRSVLMSEAVNPVIIDKKNLKVPFEKATTSELKPEAANSAAVPPCLGSTSSVDTINDSNSSPTTPNDSIVVAPGIQLLKALWRSSDQDHQIGVLDRESQKFRNTSIKDAIEAVKLAQENSYAGSDTYFACAEYETSKNRTCSRCIRRIRILAGYRLWCG